MKFKRLMTVIVCFAFIVSCCFVATACDGGATFTLTLDYDTDGGTVVLTPQKDAYSSKDDITVTVNANEGYEVGKMLLDTYDATDDYYDHNMSYTFNLSRNRTLKVEWQRAGTRLETASVWKVDLDYPTTAGKVSIEPASQASNGRYANNAALSAIIEPIQGATIDKVYIGETEYTPTEKNGNYVVKFNVTANTNVRVDFNEDLTQFFYINERVDKQDFLDSLGYGTVLIDLFYTTCQYCIDMEPDLEAFLEENTGVKVLRVKVGENGTEYNEWVLNGLGEGSNTRNLYPFLILYNNKEVVKAEAGGKTLAQLIEFVKLPAED